MNKIRQFETVDLQNSPDSTRHVTHTIEIQMKEQQKPASHDHEPSFQLENLNENEDDSTTKL